MLPSQTDLHNFVFSFLQMISLQDSTNTVFFADFLRTCPVEQEAVSWVQSLHCDVSDEMCQEGGLPHTEYFNISCFKHDVGEHYGSCSEICNSDKFTHKQKCDAYCSCEYSSGYGD